MLANYPACRARQAQEQAGVRVLWWQLFAVSSDSATHLQAQEICTAHLLEAFADVAVPRKPSLTLSCAHMQTLLLCAAPELA